jgi:hypothetical protein
MWIPLQLNSTPARRYQLHLTAVGEAGTTCSSEALPLDSLPLAPKITTKERLPMKKTAAPKKSPQREDRQEAQARSLDGRVLQARGRLGRRDERDGRQALARLMYLLDANVLMHLANRSDGHESIREKMKSLRKSDFAVSDITKELARSNHFFLVNPSAG